MKKRLTKSSTNITLTGTLAGIAEYFNVDPTLVRIIFIIVSIPLWGSPVLLYILLVLIVPSAKKGNDRYSSSRDYRDSYYRYSDSSQPRRPRKEAKKVEEDDWSDF